MIVSSNYLEDVKNVALNIENISELKDKSVLITGASGLIGSSVADLLFAINNQNNRTIRILLAGRNKSTLEKRFYYRADNDYQYVYFDMLNDSNADLYDGKLDYVIHCAGNCSPRLYSTEPVETMMGCVNGTNKLLKYSKEHGVKRVLYVSSSEVYGIKNDQLPYTEDQLGYIDLSNPRSCYPISKRAAETLCASYIDEYHMDIAIVRPGHVYGAAVPRNDDRAPAQFVRNAKRNEPIVMKSAGLQLRSYCNSLDVAGAILSVLISGSKGEAYNISNKSSVVTIREFAEAIAKAANVSIRYEKPNDAEKKGYNLMSNSSLSSSKIEALGWRAQVSLSRGVRQMLDCFEE